MPSRCLMSSFLCLFHHPSHQRPPRPRSAVEAPPREDREAAGRRGIRFLRGRGERIRWTMSLVAAVLLLLEPVAVDGFPGCPPFLLGLVGGGLLRNIVVVEPVEVAVLASLAGRVFFLAEVAPDAWSLVADHPLLDLSIMWGDEARRVRQLPPDRWLIRDRSRVRGPKHRHGLGPLRSVVGIVVLLRLLRDVVLVVEVV